MAESDDDDFLAGLSPAGLKGQTKTTGEATSVPCRAPLPLHTHKEKLYYSTAVGRHAVTAVHNAL